MPLPRVEPDIAEMVDVVLNILPCQTTFAPEGSLNVTGGVRSAALVARAMRFESRLLNEAMNQLE